MTKRTVQCLPAEVGQQENLQEDGVAEEVEVAPTPEQEGQELLGQEMVAVWSHEGGQETHFQTTRVTAVLTEAGTTRGHQTDLRPEVAVEVAVEAIEDRSGAGAEAVVVVAEALSKAPHSVEAAVDGAEDEAEDVEAVVEEAGVGGEGGRAFQLIIK